MLSGVVSLLCIAAMHLLELMDSVNIELEFAWAGQHKARFKDQRPQVCVMCDSSGKMVSTPLAVNLLPTPEAFVNWLRKSKSEAKGNVSTGPPWPTGTPSAQAYMVAQQGAMRLATRNRETQ